METTEKTVYWLCKETIFMRGTNIVAFKKDEKYPQVKPFKNNLLTLKNESGAEHIISPDLREQKFEEVK